MDITLELPIILAVLTLSVLFVLLSFRLLRNVLPKEQQTGDGTLDELISEAGYLYDPDQEIFYSKIDAWQRKFGYCRLYDEAAAPAGMILDCEPITFDAGGKRWLVQLWKGQYGLNTGGEIGVYIAKKPDLRIPGVFDGTFYRCAGKNERLFLAYSLIKNGEEIFRRGEKHWWLTGFKLGEFSEPSELKMNIRIVFKDSQMRDAFIEALLKIGYQDWEILRNSFTVGFVFDKTHTPQPLTRTEETEWLVQRSNERLCAKYQEITEAYDTLPEKLMALKAREPFLYQAVLTIGKGAQIFKAFDKIKKYLV